MKSISSLMASIVVVTATTLASSAHAAWTAPIGIPVPPFGINEVAPAAPSPWDATRTTNAGYQFYYICPTCAGATDSANPYGYPAKPRSTIPNPLPAGSVVEIHGLYAQRHTSPNTLVSNGTAVKPVFVRGANSTSRPIVTQAWEFKGTYAIIENIEFSSDGLTLLAPGSYLAVRNSDIHGNSNAGGLGVVSWSNDSIDHVVVYNNKIHDNGDVNASYDQDVHGIGVSNRVSYLWIVDNEIARNSGDGIQINAGSAALQPTTHHIYVGRNISHHNKQTGFWTKQAVDVIFSQNTSYGHRTSNSSAGDGMGGQYAPSNVWFLYNRIYDNESGIRIASDSGMGIGTDIYIIGNLIYNIHKVSSAYNVNSGYESGAISLWGGTNTYVINNTMWDIDAGINSPRQYGKIDIYNNIIGSASVSGSSQIFLEFSTLASASAMDFNLLENTTSIRWGEGSGMRRTLSSFQSVFGKGINSAATSTPGFTNAASGDFRLNNGSPAIDKGTNVDMINSANVYARFQSRYGIDIRKDLMGSNRPQGSGYDIGAYEYGANVVLPGAPNNMRARTP